MWLLCLLPWCCWEVQLRVWLATDPYHLNSNPGMASPHYLCRLLGPFKYLVMCTIVAKRQQYIRCQVLQAYVNMVNVRFKRLI